MDDEELLANNELMYENFGDFSVESLEYLIYMCEIIIESKLWKEGF